MNPQVQEAIQTIIQSSTKQLSRQMLTNIELLVQQAHSEMSEKQFKACQPQWSVFSKKLNTHDKLAYLKQQNCRTLIIRLIREEAVHLFNTSYFNRAKIDNQYIIYLKQLGPHFFTEVIRIVSKLKIIHKHYYQKMSTQFLQSHISMKILKILQLCNTNLKSLNNNKSKFLCIVEEAGDRLQITKELSKMLRESWKRQKSKTEIIEQQSQSPTHFYQIPNQLIRKVTPILADNVYQNDDNSVFDFMRKNDSLNDIMELSI